MEKTLKTLGFLHVTRFIGLQGKLSHAASLFEVPTHSATWILYICIEYTTVETLPAFS
jgi:hypothetical protein